MSETHAGQTLSPTVKNLAVRLRMFDRPSTELQNALHPPWPDWMGARYGLEAAGDQQIDADAGVVTVSAALGALAEELRHRLDVLSFVCGAVETLGWEVTLDGDTLLARTHLTRDAARSQLEHAGVAGPMCKVSEIDDDGWPLMFVISEVAPSETAP